ncbi:MAG: penicillin-binding transpeptidase domain-containing protein [Planctomycetota bacterium]|nr:penicillin-binding transpeptidase domain-containing protein [Planctomycetota bacterium]
MVAQRRLQPLGIVVILGLGVLAARLFQVQVLEHDVWAAQAASFRTSSRVVPYHRGRFLDREGRVLVADEDAASLEFVYRDFRRGHPLGLAAHARTAIEARPVGLAETEPRLEEWCRRIASLSPASIEAFALGHALRDADGLELAPEVADPEPTARAGRAADLRFYVAQILALTRRESGPARRRIEAGEADRPWSAIAAAVRGTNQESVIATLTRRAEESRGDLRVLAGMLDEQKILGTGSTAVTDPLTGLLALFDQRRADQEDEAADDLFRTATGFGPGRVPTEALRDTFDLAWIARALRWDAARLESWIATRRGDFERELDEFLLPRLLARADLGESEGARAQRLLDGLASLWRAGDARAADDRAWTDLESLAVLHESRSLFRSARGAPGTPADAPVLPFQDEDYRALAAVEPDPWRTVGLLFEAAALRAGLASPTADEIAARWTRLSASRKGLDGDEALDELRRAARSFEADFSGSVLRTLSALRGAAPSDGAPPPPLQLAEERLDRAAQRERFVLVDAQSRATRLAADPGYALVQLVARDPERYTGFAVRETTRRVARVRDADGAVAAGLLIGGTRRPLLRELLAQSEDERRLASLQYRLLRSEEEDRELRELSTRLARADEWTGDNGLESWFDTELRGRFGMYETEGLDAEERGEGTRLVPAIDGQDVALTLDARLQVAAQDVLAHPRLPATGDTDRTWFENPVGAIVLLTPEGEILAAASVPTLPGAANVPGRGYERSHPRERTAQTPTFNPPGSVFKPFVAAYALDRLGFDPATRFECSLNASNQPAFETLRCNSHHIESDLHHALAVSCNAYFAQLGLRFQPRELLEAAHTFGFGEPTGLRFDPREGRRGLREDWKASPDIDEAGMLKRLQSRFDLLRFPNGLGLLWASPLQVARATAGLATGVLPEVRVVRAIGGVPVAGASRPLGISNQSLEFVRAAMRAVVEEPGGSGHGKGLDAGTLGFTFACKTGSADIGKIHEVPGMPDEDRAAGAAGKSRKHTWVAGWFPAEKPVAVVVVYLHNLTETASRTAVHVAAQLLQTDAVREFVARKGAQ